MPRLEEEEEVLEVAVALLKLVVLSSGRGISIGDWNLPVLHTSGHCAIPSGSPYSHCCSSDGSLFAAVAARLGGGGQQRHVAGETMAVVQAMSWRREGIILHLCEWFSSFLFGQSRLIKISNDCFCQFRSFNHCDISP